ncbi:TPA: ash family protein, partial [Serratia marcescens]|nr:ash family protein [Serratia marcescens]
MITLCSIKGIAYQEKASLLAGNQSGKLSSDHSVNILAQYSAKSFAQQSAKVLADVSAKIYANLKHGEITPFAKGEKNHLCKGQKSAILQGLIGVTTRGGIEFLQSIKGKIIEFFESIKKGNQSATLGNVDIKYRASQKFKISNELDIGKGVITKNIHIFDGYHLRLLLNVGYIDLALAKSSVRICTLNPYKATHDAPSVFFCVYAYAHPRFAVLYRPNSMVMLAGQPKGWLVSLYASSANPVSVTTSIEICTSGGDSLALYKEIIVMMATPTQTQ